MSGSLSPRACLAFTLFLLCLAPLRAAPWLKLQTDDMVVYSDASPKDVIEYAVGYAAYRHAFRELFAPNQPLPPVRVLLFRRLSVLQRHLPEPKDMDTQMVWFTTEVDGDALVAISVDGDRDEALQRTYEFDTIWVLRRIGYFLPIWMSQGTGEVLSSLELKKTSCAVGDGPEHFYQQWPNDDALPWDRFFDVHTASKEYTGPKATGTYHAQAWALMHRILLEGNDGPERFRTLAAKLRTNPALKSVESVLGLPAKDFDRDVQAHLKRHIRREFPFDSASLRKQLQVAPAPEAEVHIQLANLLFETDKRPEAEKQLAQAKAIAPDAAIVKEALARRALQNDELDVAAQLYRDAIQAGSTNPMAYLISARRRMDDSSLGATDYAGGGGPEIEKAITELRQALRLHPGSADAYRLLGRAFFLSPKIGADNIEELSRGVGPGLAGAQVRLYRALLHQRLGQNDEYVADLRQVYADSADDVRLQRNVRERLDTLEFAQNAKEIERLAKLKQYDEAGALLTKAMSGDVDRNVAGKYEQLRTWMEEKRDWEAAMRLYRERHWDEFLTVANKFLENHPNSRAPRDVHRMIDSAQLNSRKTQVPAAPARSDNGASAGGTGS